VDPRFHQTLQMAQYSIQYLVGCQNLLTQRAELIENALKVFQTEEDDLDFQIAKMKLIPLQLLRLTLPPLGLGTKLWKEKAMI
jgi:hypothetical protein